MSQSHENFLRLAENRTRKTIRLIRLIGNLSNRSNYSYSTSEVKKIFGTLEAELKKSRRRFEERGASTVDASFTLRSQE
jgi:ribosome biogenesis protein Nip4